MRVAVKSIKGKEFIERYARQAGLIVLVLFLLYVLVKNAWLSDDAFITFRVSSNLIHGFGPTWNVAERVQAFSNPLWMLLMAPFQLLARFHGLFSGSLSPLALCLYV
jgi:hypothetical protein